LVLAFDQKRNEGLPPSGVLAIAGPNPSLALKSADPLAFAASMRWAREPEAISATFVPFADAGRDGGFYRVWLRAPGAALAQNLSLLSDGAESRSRRGNVAGSINDGEADSYVVTFDGKPAAEDWFAVTVPVSITISRVVFRHGDTFHDGGWFDTSAGKPSIQVKRDRDSQWETVAELTDYPATSATDSAGLKPGQALSQRLPAPTKVIAVRVIGKPACGDNPAQAFASCAELEAFGH
jgi:hypothetical protein